MVPLQLARFLMAWMLTSVGLAATATPGWQPWLHLPGVFDLAGPRSDGRLVAAAGGQLYLVSAEGTIASQLRIGHPDVFPAGQEAYLDVSPGLHVSGANCNFARDDVFIIRPVAPLGIIRVDAEGLPSNFLDLKGLDSLNGIVFDRMGRFDHRLLVSGPHNQRTTILAIDCRGGIVTITDSAPPVEGGLAVAPSNFGSHGGDLIAPDENSGAVWTISATGHVEQLVQSGIPHGGDIGVESAAFIPPGFSAGGTAYVADRGTPGNPHPGTDNILRMASSDMVAAGVHEGDLIVAAEGGAVTIDVRCAASCVTRTIVPTGTTAHIEGHVVMVANQKPPTPSPLPAVADLGSQRAQLILRVGVGVLIAAALLLLVAVRMRRARRR